MRSAGIDIIGSAALQWVPRDTEKKVPCAENPVLSKVLPVV